MTTFVQIQTDVNGQPVLENGEFVHAEGVSGVPIRNGKLIYLPENRFVFDHQFVLIRGNVENININGKWLTIYRGTNGDSNGKTFITIDPDSVMNYSERWGGRKYIKKRKSKKYLKSKTSRKSKKSRK